MKNLTNSSTDQGQVTEYGRSKGYADNHPEKSAAYQSAGPNSDLAWQENNITVSVILLRGQSQEGKQEVCYVMQS